MRVKQRAEDFRVRELLGAETLGAAGEYRVYRVTKRKLSSLEAAARLAELAGASAGDVSMAGLKDRQGVTTQYMALRHGRSLSVREADLRIEDAGFAREEITSEASAGNAFEIVVRGLDGERLADLRSNLALVRAHGVVNYFDDQRFGNLRHGQGWIALELLRGEHEAALRSLLCAPSPRDDPRTRSFKSGLARNWGDWAACRDVAGRFGAHHSIFEHLKKHDGDFAGAFFHVATRVRLIHLYAFQSHLWNRAVADFVRQRVPAEQRIVIASAEGPLVYPPAGLELEPGLESFRLPGPRLEDVTHPVQRALLEDALATLRLVPADLAIEGVPGFQLKGEDRPLLVHPRHLRVRPAEPDPLHRGLRLVRVRFELPRGSYATLVVERLLAPSASPQDASGSASARGARSPATAHRESGSAHERRGERDERPPRSTRNERGGQRGRERVDRGARGAEPRARDERSRVLPRSDFVPPRPRGAPQDRARGGDRAGGGDRQRGGDRARGERRDHGPRGRRPTSGPERPGRSGER